MKKNIEWLKSEILELSIKARHKENNQREWHMGHEMALFDVNKLIDQLDEPEKPVIPQFVADWIEETKKQSKSLVFAITHIYDNNEIGKSPNKEEKRIFQWMESADNEEVFARAWLDGYEVEKEKKYQVIIRDGEYIRLYLCKPGDNVMIGTNDNYIEKFPEVTYLTEKEIKDFDERYFVFAKEVAE